MKIVKFETWWVKRNKCLFDEKRKGKSSMDWDVVVLKLTTDNGYEGIATALAARSGRVTESYLHDNIAPVVLGASPYDREKIWHELWNIDRHLTSVGYLRQGSRTSALSIHRRLPPVSACICQRAVP